MKVVENVYSEYESVCNGIADLNTDTADMNKLKEIMQASATAYSRMRVQIDQAKDWDNDAASSIKS